MIPGAQYNHLSFNPRRQPKGDKPQRHPHQFKLQLQPPSTFSESRGQYYRQLNKDLEEKQMLYMQQQAPAAVQ